MMPPTASLMWTYWIASAVLWLGLSMVVIRRWRLPQKPAPLIIFGVAALVRVGYLFMPPVLSDDIWRYVHDGRTLADGTNPYAMSPAEAIRDAPQAEAYDADGAAPDWRLRINNPELVTIYQPTSQWVFAATTKLTDVLVRHKADADEVSLALRLLFSVCDMVIVLLIMRQLKTLGRSAWWAVMYAWNPLVFTETAWSGHQESLGIVLMLTTFILAQDAAVGWRSWRSWPHTILAGVAGGLAIGVKPIVLPLLLPLLWRLRGEPRPFRRMAASTAACAATLAALYLPFILMEGGLTRMVETARAFVGIWRFNGSLHPLVENAASSKPVADVVMACLLGAALLAGTFFHRVPWRAATTYLFAAICVSSTVHPWYLLWALALVPVSWSTARSVVAPAVWVASLTLPWSYAALLSPGHDGSLGMSLTLRLLVWVPVYAALAYGAVTVVRSLRDAEWQPLGGRG